MRDLKTLFIACLLGIAGLYASAARAGPHPQHDGQAADFAVLSAAPDGAGVVTCTDSTIAGSVGSSGQPASVIQTRCTITGAIVAPVSAAVLADFARDYDALGALTCDRVLTGTLAGITLAPGVYCFDAAAVVTGTLTLDGPANATWTFLVGTSGTGALTGTDFTVLMTGGAQACNVYWWVAEAATMTTSAFKGSILAGAAITVTGGDFEGRALATAAVTLTDAGVSGCASNFQQPRGRCNQGVGNGAEACDPGNSNQGDPLRSNDELGGLPGEPGRKGGNK